MAIRLRDEVKKQIISNNQLMVDYCACLGISVFSLPKMFERNSKTLTQHNAVQFLSDRLNKPTNKIITESRVSA